MVTKQINYINDAAISLCIFVKRWDCGIFFLLIASLGFSCSDQAPLPGRPNILLLMSDNHYAYHLSCYGDQVVQTPNIDNIASLGVRFNNAFCAAPSCSPARAGLLTGQDSWRLEEGANLWGILPDKFTFYTDLLEESGYFVGSQGKGWGPGSVEDSGRKTNHGGKKYNSFDTFLMANRSGGPWCFWYSSQDPHRPYNVGSGVASGMDLNKIKVPPFLPDNDITRGDIADYYYEIQNFDRQVGNILKTLEESGQGVQPKVSETSTSSQHSIRGVPSSTSCVTSSGLKYIRAMGRVLCICNYPVNDATSGCPDSQINTHCHYKSGDCFLCEVPDNSSDIICPPDMLNSVGEVGFRLGSTCQQ